MTNSQLTASSLLAAATETLIQGGYTASDEIPTSSGSSTTRVFEDPYGVVSIVVHDTWRSLASNWQDDQAHLVEQLTLKVGPGDAKAWEGYLVLLTPGITATIEERTTARQIRYDTSRVRKLVATAEEIRTIGGVTRVLMPLLPLPESELGRTSRDVLETLPSLLEESRIPVETTRRLIEAYKQQTPLLSALEPTGWPS